MSGYGCVLGEGVYFEDDDFPEAYGGTMPDLEDLLQSSGEGEMFDDLLDSPSGGGGMLEDVAQGSPSGGAVEDHWGLAPRYYFLEGESSIDLNASPPGILEQAPPPVATVSQPCSPPNACTVLEPPSLEIDEMMEWKRLVAEWVKLLPNDILRKVPRKRGQERYSYLGQKYKPCSWETFIELVNEEINSGKLKVQRPKRKRCTLRDSEETKDPVVVALQAQSEIYGNYFNANTFFSWD